jgi:NitT/TauT family transport system substrate-binding protein
MGGPQVNVMQLMAAGQTDCVMADVAQTIKGWEQGVMAVTVAAAFQKDPQVLIGHVSELKRLEDLKGKTILISPAGQQTYWPWLRNKLGLLDSQVRPYTFNIQPFVADKNVVQQGYLSSEPWEIESRTGTKPAVFLLADHGWPPYSTTIVCMEKTLKERPRAVAAFVKASMQGWRDYLLGDARAANALILKDNPAMTDVRLAVGIKMMKESGMVLGGDAARLGVGVMTDERMKLIHDLMLQLKQIDPKVELKRTYTLQFVRDLRVMP